MPRETSPRGRCYKLCGLAHWGMRWKSALEMLGKWGLLRSSYQPAADKIPWILCGWEDDLDKVSIREAGERRCREKLNNGGNWGCYSQFCSIHAQRSSTGGKASNTMVRIQSFLHKWNRKDQHPYLLSLMPLGSLNLVLHSWSLKTI